MRLLVDTHAFLWLESEPQKLSKRATHLLADQNNDVFLSVASAWEMQIKIQLGKLKLRQSLERVIAFQVQVNRVQILPVMPGHIYALGRLPLHHKDPFDRLIVAAAQAEYLIVVSHDPALKKYPIHIEW